MTLVLSLDGRDPRPIGERLARAIRARIESGHLPPGTRLPPSRALAGDLGVGRNAVVTAYRRLVEDGWLEARVGRGTFVTREAAESDPRAPASRRAREFSWAPLVAREASPLAPAQAAARGGSGVIDLAGAVPSEETYPVERMRQILNEVLRTRGAAALGYGPPEGDRELREIIATRASRLGTAVRPEDVIVVSGLQQGLDLLARLLLAPGDTVVVESPTYANALDIWRLYGARPVGVALDERGLDPRPLAAALARSRPKLMYTMPTFQNPTGLTMDEARRREIMAIAQEAAVPVIEDHFDTELRYRGRPLPPLGAFDESGQTVQLGSFSKILFPGFRLGWMIVPSALRDRLVDMKRTCEISTGLPVQMALAAFCARGELDRHLERVCLVHGERLEAMLAAIDRELPPGVHTTRPEGGMTVWVTLPAGCAASELSEASLRRGVAIASGGWFFPEGDGQRHVRLSFVNESPERIAQGVSILGDVLRELGNASSEPERGTGTPFL